jgi:hypothetical protein
LKETHPINEFLAIKDSYIVTASKDLKKDLKKGLVARASKHKAEDAAGQEQQLGAMSRFAERAADYVRE